MKPIPDINILINETKRKKTSESNDDKNINYTNKNSLPLLIHLREKTAQPVMAKRKNYLFKRLSPFLLLAAFLMVLFPYMIISGTGNIESTWFKIALFPFLLTNVLFADFVIWNYFEGKKRFKIWVIELFLSALIIYLLL